MLIFDVETNGLYDDVDYIHCLVVYDTSSKTLHIFDQNHLRILDGIKMLENAEKICGHNIIGYDVPVLKKIYPWFSPKGEVADTLIISRVAFPDVKMADYGRFQKGELPGKLIGAYSLESVSRITWNRCPVCSGICISG